MKPENFQIVLIFILAFIVGLFIGLHFRKAGNKEIITNTEYIKGDTVYVTKANKVFIQKTDTVKVIDNKLSAKLDTIIVSNLDTIKLGIEINADTIKTDWFIDIEHKDVQLLRVDTLKQFEIREIEVEKDLAFYQQPYFNFIAGVITAIIIILGSK